MTTYNSADAIADVSGATYNAIKARFRELADVVDAVGAERKVLRDELKRREQEAAIKVRLGALRESDKAVYREVLK